MQLSKYSIQSILILLLSMTVNAQQFLLVNSGLSIGYTEYPRINWHFVLDTKGHEFIGFYEDTNSSKLLINDGGRIIGLPFVSPINKEHTVGFKKEWFKQEGKNTTFSHNNIFLKIYNNGLKVECFRDTTLLWTKRYRQMALQPLANYTDGFQKPILSPDQKTIVFQLNWRLSFFTRIRPRIVVVDVDSGNLHVIERNGFNPSFSVDGKYLMLQKNPRNPYVIIYDRINNKKNEYFDWVKAYWL